jgi:serine/threonine protein kinase
MEHDSVFDLGPEQLDRLLSIGSEEDGFPEEGEDKALIAPNGSGAVRPGVSLAGVIEQPGGWIDRYQLLAVLGEGGMGVVYLAEQKQPLRRKVALKVIKPGMDSARVIARFEAERQALALLDHPNIAHVYDAGTTQAGRPYFVMEHVEGLPITDYCDEHKLTIEQRLSCSSRSARRSSTPTRRGSFIGTSNRRISWSPRKEIRQSRRSSTSVLPRLSGIP